MTSISTATTMAAVACGSLWRKRRAGGRTGSNLQCYGLPAMDERNWTLARQRWRSKCSRASGSHDQSWGRRNTEDWLAWRQWDPLWKWPRRSLLLSLTSKSCWLVTNAASGMVAQLRGSQVRCFSQTAGGTRATWTDHVKETQNLETYWSLKFGVANCQISLILL